MEIGQLIRQAAAELTESESANLDAQLLLAKVLNEDRVWLMTWSDKQVSGDHQSEFLKLIERRKVGEPIAYILGSREFWGRQFICNEHTLIPRPDTEVLIEQVLALDLPEQASVLDLGTGTGCIALTLAAERSDWKVLAADYSLEAVAIAEKNRKSLNLENAKVIQSDWYSMIPEGSRFDLIVSNPPYIDPKSHYLDEGDVRFEPDLALTSGQDGLASLRTVIGTAPEYLESGGWAAVEHGYDQAESVRQILTESGFHQILQERDLAGIDRCAVGKLN